MAVTAVSTPTCKRTHTNKHPSTTAQVEIGRCSSSDGDALEFDHKERQMRIRLIGGSVAIALVALFSSAAGGRALWFYPTIGAAIAAGVPWLRSPLSRVKQTAVCA